MLYVPRHLPNKLEYKVLSCISVHYQLRMASNGIVITPSHPPTVQAGQYEVGWGGTLGAFGCLCLGNRVMHLGGLLVLYLGTLCMLLLVDLRFIRFASWYSAGRAIHGGGWVGVECVGGGLGGGGKRGIWQDAPEYNLIDCIHKTIFSNVLEGFL